MKTLHEIQPIIPADLMLLAQNILDVDRYYIFKVRNGRLWYTIQGAAWSVTSENVIRTYGRRTPATTEQYARSRFRP